MSRKFLEDIYFNSLFAVKAENFIPTNLFFKDNELTIQNQTFKIQGNLYVYGVGKASVDMAKYCERVLGDKIQGGLVISNNKNQGLSLVKYKKSTHPILSSTSIEAAEELINEFKTLKEDDFILFLLSGGASSMIEKPIEGLSLEEFQKASKALINSGLDIKALNTIRKSISNIKGGKLADTTKANGAVLVLSDVIGDELSSIGSAPMLRDKFPHFIVANNTIALKSGQEFIQKNQIYSNIITTTLDKNSADAAQFIKGKIEEYKKTHDSFCLLFAGETTTIVSSGGIGGRNQELALRLMMLLENDKDIEVLVAGSDGKDGNSDATGAFVDKQTYENANNLDKEKYLKQSNSNIFFKKCSSDFVTGLSGTNVMDFIIVLKNQ